MAKSKETENKDPGPLVKEVEVHHALRASLQTESADGGRYSTYSTLEVGIMLHIELPPSHQTGDKYKEVVDKFASELMKMVTDRVHEDAKQMNLVAFTDFVPGEQSSEAEGEQVASLD